MLDLLIFLLVVVLFVVVALWLITKLPPPVTEIAWILQIAVVLIALAAVIYRLLPALGVA